MPINPVIRANFSEVARDLIAADRTARKYGSSKNTIGAIERALSNAYLLGQSHTAGETVKAHISNTTSDWVTIPPISRETLAELTVGFSTRYSLSIFEPYEIERIIDNGKVRWAIVSSGVRETRSLANGSVAPLVRMGLIAPIEVQTQRYRLTNLGIETSKDYWRRSDANDPTLPREGMR